MNTVSQKTLLSLFVVLNVLIAFMGLWISKEISICFICLQAAVLGLIKYNVVCMLGTWWARDKSLLRNHAVCPNWYNGLFEGRERRETIGSDRGRQSYEGREGWYRKKRKGDW